MDKKDMMMLEALQKNSKLSTQALSRLTRIPITTVHHRIKKLEKEGIIQGYTVHIDFKRLGRPIAAYILITVNYDILKKNKSTQYELIQKLKKHPDVYAAAMLTGESDIIIKVRAHSVEALNEFVTIYLRNIDGVEKTRTAIILNEA